MVENIREFLLRGTNKPVHKYELQIFSKNTPIPAIEVFSNLDDAEIVLNAYEVLMTSHKNNTELLLIKNMDTSSNEESKPIIESMTLSVYALFKKEVSALECIESILAPYAYEKEIFFDIDISLNLIGLLNWQDDTFNIDSIEDAKNLFISVGKKEEVDDDFDLDFDFDLD